MARSRLRSRSDEFVSKHSLLQSSPGDGSPDHSDSFLPNSACSHGVLTCFLLLPWHQCCKTPPKTYNLPGGCRAAGSRQVATTAAGPARGAAGQASFLLSQTCCDATAVAAKVPCLFCLVQFSSPGWVGVARSQANSPGFGGWVGGRCGGARKLA